VPNDTARTQVGRPLGIGRQPDVRAWLSHR